MKYGFGVDSPNDYDDSERFAFNMYAITIETLSSVAQYIFDNYDPNQFNNANTLEDACCANGISSEYLTSSDLETIEDLLESML